MSVQEQIPYVEYVGNGVTKAFPVTFDCEDQDHLIVTIDGAELPVGQWNLLNERVEFKAPPSSGALIEIKRDTPLERTTTYQTYNNSFRPEPVNQDFDRIWWKLQELGLADWLLSKRLNKEIQDRIAADIYYYTLITKETNLKVDQLRTYIDRFIEDTNNKTDDLKNYIDTLVNNIVGGEPFLPITDFSIDTWSGVGQRENNRRRKYLEDFGGVGDGRTVNDAALRKAIFHMDDGETLWFQDQSNYFFNNIDVIKKSINIKCEGQATITQDNPAATGILYDSDLVAVTMLSQTQYINSRHWRVESTEGIKKGYLFVVKSNLSWYFDPRPDSTDARKSELHRVLFVDHNSKTVVTECESNDGYADSEYVEVKIYKPISAFVENIEVINKQRGVRQGSGIRFRRGSNCKILNNTITDYGSTPMGLEECYASYQTGNSVTGCVENSTYAGKITGCTLSFAIGNTLHGNFAAIDISGFNIISMMCGAIGNTVFGGGVNSAGESLGYKDGVRGAVTRGVGSHAATDRCVFLNNKLYDCVNGGVVIRGRNHIVDGNVFYGRYITGCIKLYDGMAATVTNNKVDNSYYGGKETTTQPGVGNLHSQYPNAFVHVASNWHSDPRNPTIIKGNRSITHTSFIELAGDGLKYCKDIIIDDNDITFAQISSSIAAELIHKRPAVTADVEIGSGFHIGKNRVKTYFQNPGFRLFSESIRVKRGVHIETQGSVESTEVSVKGAVNWQNPKLQNFKLNFNGGYAELDFAIHEGVLSAADGVLYSCDLSVPLLGNQISNSAVMGSCSGFDVKGLVSLGATGEVRITAKRDTTSNVPQIRGYAKYPIGL